LLAAAGAQASPLFDQLCPAAAFAPDTNPFVFDANGSLDFEFAAFPSEARPYFRNTLCLSDDGGSTYREVFNTKDDLPGAKVTLDYAAGTEFFLGLISFSPEWGHGNGHLIGDTDTAYLTVDNLLDLGGVLTVQMEDFYTSSQGLFGCDTANPDRVSYQDWIKATSNPDFDCDWITQNVTFGAARAYDDFSFTMSFAAPVPSALLLLVPGLAGLLASRHLRRGDGR
jgi:hypothetical protein